MTTKTITITDSTDSTEHKHGNLYLCEGELLILTRVEGFTTLTNLLNCLPYNYCSTKVSNDITHSDWEFLTDGHTDKFKLVKTVNFNVTL